MGSSRWTKKDSTQVCIPPSIPSSIRLSSSIYQLAHCVCSALPPTYPSTYLSGHLPVRVTIYPATHPPIYGSACRPRTAVCRTLQWDPEESLCKPSQTAPKPLNPKTRNPKLQNPKPSTPKPSALHSKPETLNPKPLSPNLKPEALNPKPENCPWNAPLFSPRSISQLLSSSSRPQLDAAVKV